LYSEDTGSKSVAVGNDALKNQNYDGDAYNVAVGFDAGNDITTGLQNVFVGALAGDALTTGTSNIAIGYAAMSTANGSESRNVAIGQFALFAMDADGNNYNVAIGYDAGRAITTGVENTIVGGLAGDSLTTGARNIAIGTGALGTEDEHGRNVAIGWNSLPSLNAGSDAYNTAVGYNTGAAMTTGLRNTLIGGFAGDGLTTGQRM